MSTPKKKKCVIYVVIGSDYIKIMRILTEMESDYIKKIKSTNSDARRYYLDGVHTLRAAKKKIKEKYEEKSPEEPRKAWYQSFWGS